MYHSAFLAFFLGFLSAAQAGSIEGRWDATLTWNGAAIPFRLDISGSGPTLRGTLYNGDIQEFTTRASFENGKLVLALDHYLVTIEATITDGRLVGAVHMRGDKRPEGSPFEAVRHRPKPAAEAHVPAIGGQWIIPVDSNSKGEKAWRFLVRQNGPEVSATILRIDGDTGALTGAWRDGKLMLSHFDGSRPYLVEVAVAEDGSLTLDPKTGGARAHKMVAYRPDTARAKGIPEPENYTTHTTARDSSEVFTFRFPDVNGAVFSNDDPKFKGKVVLAIVTGTWCPNCHDEARYLVELYKKYRGRGLEIVALDFEEPEQQNGLARVRAFMKQYGVEYTYLIAGAPAEIGEKVPQLVNWNTWPATVFIRRDGRIDHVHAGFAAPASREFHAELNQEFTSTIERLLKEPAGKSAAWSGSPVRKATVAFESGN